ncbi:MAG TPA: hypothetical protein G4O12_02945 [Dehalococcoidia bacterium]|nr:hypothetical protein [Dehalococcoidia bacterium]
MSSVLSYWDPTICSHIWAKCLQIKPAIAIELPSVLIGLAVGVVVTCLILAALILAVREKAVSGLRRWQTSVLEPMPKEAIEKSATLVETLTLAETLAPRETIEEEVTLVSAPAATTGGVAEVEEMVNEEVKQAVLPKTGLRVEDISQKRQPRNRSPWQRTTIAPFDITELKIDPAEARPGEPVTISFKAINDRDVRSYYNVILRINGEVADAEVMSLPRRATLPMSFIVVRDLPGVYKVAVGESTAKLTILGKDLESEVGESEVFKSKMNNLEARIALGLVPVERHLKQKKVLDGDITPSSGSLQSIIDKVADSIESGLDKMGDGMIFPVERMVNVFTAVFKTLNWKSKK